MSACGRLDFVLSPFEAHIVRCQTVHVLLTSWRLCY